MMHKGFILVTVVLLVVIFTPHALTQSDQTIADAEKSFATWLKELDSPKKQKQWNALGSIERWNHRATSAVPHIYRLLVSTKDLKTRAQCLLAMAELRHGTIPELTQALWSKEQHVRYGAILVLSRMKSAARPAVPSLIARLQDSAAGVRHAAANLLIELQPPQVIPALLARVEDADKDMQQAAILGLIYMDVDAKLLLPTLAKMMRSDKDDQRRLAALAYSRLGSEALPALNLLNKTLKDRDAMVRRGAAQALAEIGPPAKGAVPALRKMLEQESEERVQVAAAVALWRIGRDAVVVPTLKKWLRAKRHSSPVAAAWLLWHMTKSPDVIEVFRDVLDGKQPGQSEHVLNLLIHIGPAARKALPSVVPLVKHEQVSVRNSAVYFLCRTGVHAKPFAKHLSPLLKGKDIHDRYRAAMALWHINKDNKGLIQFAELLQHKDKAYRQEAADILRHLDANARAVLPALEKAFDDTDAQVRVNAAKAAWAIGEHPKFLSILTKEVFADAPEVRADAALFLGAELRDKAHSAVPVLIQALWDRDADVGSAAAEALGRIGPKAHQAIPALVTLLAAPELPQGLYSSTAEALGLMGPAAKEAVPELVKKLDYPNSFVQVNAAKALWHIAKDPRGFPHVHKGITDNRPDTRVYAAEALWAMNHDKRVLPTLLSIVRGEHYILDRAQGRDTPRADNLRYMAVRALGRIGPSAKIAVPDLEPYLHSDDRLMRVTVAWALQQIRGK